MFNLTIESASGDTAKKKRAELARLLRYAATQLDLGTACGYLRDADGKRVGEFDWTSPDEPSEKENDMMTDKRGDGYRLLDQQIDEDRARRVHVAKGPVENPRPMNPRSRVFDETPPHSPRKHSTAAFRDMPVGGSFEWTWNREGTKKIRVWVPGR